MYASESIIDGQKIAEAIRIRLLNETELLRNEPLTNRMASVMPKARMEMKLKAKISFDRLSFKKALIDCKFTGRGINS